MTAIGRALMSRPTLLLLDEPSMGLAPLAVRAIFEALARLNREDGLSVLLAEQNHALARRYAHRALGLAAAARHPSISPRASSSTASISGRRQER